ISRAARRNFGLNQSFEREDSALYPAHIFHFRRTENFLKRAEAGYLTQKIEVTQIRAQGKILPVRNSLGIKVEGQVRWCFRGGQGGTAQGPSRAAPCSLSCERNGRQYPWCDARNLAAPSRPRR